MRTKGDRTSTQRPTPQPSDIQEPRGLLTVQCRGPQTPSKQPGGWWPRRKRLRGRKGPPGSAHPWELPATCGGSVPGPRSHVRAETAASPSPAAPHAASRGLPRLGFAPCLVSFLRLCWEGSCREWLCPKQAPSASLGPRHRANCGDAAPATPRMGKNHPKPGKGLGSPLGAPQGSSNQPLPRAAAKRRLWVPPLGWQSPSPGPSSPSSPLRGLRPPLAPLLAKAPR